MRDGYPIVRVGVAAFMVLLTSLTTLLLYKRKISLLLFSIIAAMLCMAAFLSITNPVSLLGHGEALSKGSESYFCELDCHLAYSIANVRQTKTLHQLTANGTFFIITIKTRFDETTIATTRGNAPLQPNPRNVVVVDASGRTYSVPHPGQVALESTGESGTPLTTALRQGESYLSSFVFDLPPTADKPALFIDQTNCLAQVINRLAHQKTSLSLLN